MRKIWDVAFWYDQTYIHTIEAFVEALGDDFITAVWRDGYVEIVYAVNQ